MSEKKERMLPRRATRGKRSTQLVGEAADADKTFWEQEAFQEAASDTDFEHSGTSEDSEDSDIDDPEDEEAVGGAAAAAAAAGEEDGGKKKRAYVDPALRKRSAGPTLASLRTRRHGSQTERAAAHAEAARAAARNKSRASALARRREKVDGDGNNDDDSVRSGGSAQRWPWRSQEEEVKDAAESTLRNLSSLRTTLRREAARKRRQRRSASQAVGSALREMLRRARQKAAAERRSRQLPTVEPAYAKLSSRSKTLLTFPGRDTFPHTIHQSRKPTPLPAQCAVTGQRARYRTPKTHIPFASVEAYNTLVQANAATRPTEDRGTHPDPFEILGLE